MALDNLPRFGGALIARSDNLAQAAAQKRLQKIEQALVDIAPFAQVSRDAAAGRVTARAPAIAQRSFDDAAFHVIGRGASDDQP